MRQHQQSAATPPRILELNPEHALIRGLAEQALEDGAAATLRDTVWLLFDQARIIEGETPSDPQAFARRLSGLLLKGTGLPPVVSA